MRTDDLLLRVQCYVAVRKALGYAVRSEEKLLKDFIQFLELNRASSPIRAQTAIEWACAPAPGSIVARSREHSDNAWLYRSGSCSQREGTQQSGTRRSENKTISGG